MPGPPQEQAGRSVTASTWRIAALAKRQPAHAFEPAEIFPVPHPAARSPGALSRLRRAAEAAGCGTSMGARRRLARLALLDGWTSLLLVPLDPHSAAAGRDAPLAGLCQPSDRPRPPRPNRAREPAARPKAGVGTQSPRPAHGPPTHSESGPTSTAGGACGPEPVLRFCPAYLQANAYLRQIAYLRIRLRVCPVLRRVGRGGETRRREAPISTPPTEARGAGLKWEAWILKQLV